MPRSKTRVVVAVIVAAIAVVSVLSISLHYLTTKDSSSVISETVWIYGDEMFATSTYVTEGDGSKKNPYVIEDLTIAVSKDANPNSLDLYGMSITSTEAHLLIRNVTFYAEPSTQISETHFPRHFGVGLFDTSNVTIQSCHFGPLDRGVYVPGSSSYLNISSSSFTDCHNGVVFEAIDFGTAHGKSVVVSGNQFSACLYPVYVRMFTNVEVRDNLLYDSEEGVIGQGADGIEIHGNQIDLANVSCVNLMGIDGASVSHNAFESMTGDQPTGDGILVYMSTSVNITKNTIAYRSTGVRVVSSSVLVHHNTFLMNEVQVSISTSPECLWDDGVSEGNYWDDYSGFDSDANGVGDTPYVIDDDNVDRYPLVN